jgi:hypothetical protein
MSSASAVTVTRRTKERRLHQRYPISLKVDYRLLRRGANYRRGQWRRAAGHRDVARSRHFYRVIHQLANASRRSVSTQVGHVGAHHAQR